MIPNFSGKVYRYQQGSQQMAIEVQYVLDRDSNEKLFRAYNRVGVTPQPMPPVLRSHKEIGFYQLSVEQGKAYLHACISSNGKSVATSEQFAQSRYATSLQPIRLWKWLIGQEYLRDYRCVWNRLSIPLRENSPEQAYQVLEQTWAFWYGWWVPRFPKM